MQLEGLRILVTGGTGCIGTPLIKLLAAEGCSRIYVMGKSPHPSVATAHAVGSVTFLQGEIADAAFMAHWIAQSDIVIHLAAYVHQLPKNAIEERLLYHINVTASEAIFQLAAIYGLKKVIFISSVAVFGDTYGRVSETSAAAPLTPYAKSKYQAEESLKQIMNTHGMAYTILRPTTVFGEKDRGNVKNFLKLMKKGVAVMAGDGMNQKSMIYSQDVAKGIVATLKQDVTHGQTYILNGFHITFRDFINGLGETFGLKFCTIPIPHFIIKIMREMYPRWDGRLKALGSTQVYDGTKLYLDTGFRPEFDFIRGLKDAYAYYDNL